MGAQPKNKITRAERGKRRAGNTPSLNKDAKVTKVPLYKHTLMAKFKLATSEQKEPAKKEAAKAAPTTAPSAAQAAGVKPTKKAAAAPKKAATKTATPRKSTPASGK